MSAAPARRAWLTDRLPLLAAGLFAVLLGVRVLASEDLGYHLAYGERFLETGAIVDHDAHLYTLPPPTMAPAERPGPGPGCWYDDAGQYRFANANWGAQVMMALAHRLGGVIGLNVLLVALVATLVVLLAALMRRLGVPPPVAAAGLLVIAVTGAPRLTLRPELFGDVALVAQALLLATAWRHGARDPLDRRSVVGLVILQAVFVNLHGYFLLGLGITGATMLGAMAGAGAEDDPARRRLHVQRMALACAGQTVACFMNPWTWRLAVLPVETLLFLRRHHVAGGLSDHPWTTMGELARPDLFAPGWPGNPTVLAFLAALGIIAAGIVLASRRRRWGPVLIMSAMTLVAFASWRNMAVGTMIALPLALAALTTRGGAALPVRTTGRRALAASVSVVAVAFVLGTAAAHGAIIRLDGRPLRLGVGVSRADLPVSAARWLADHPVHGRVWASPICSSTLSGFAGAALPLNLVTNTWAYPPDIMREVLDASGSYGPRPFEPTSTRYGVSIVVAEPGPLLRQVTSEGWVPVHVEARFVVMVRPDGSDAGLARRFALTPDGFDRAAAVRTARAHDPAPARWLRDSSAALVDLGWHAAALDLLEAARASDPDDPHTWAAIAHARYDRARRTTAADLAAIGRDLRHALEAARRAAALDDDPQLAANVAAITRALAEIERVGDAGP